MTSKELRKLAERATGGDWVHTEEDDYSTNPCIRDFTGNKIIPHTRADYRYIAAASPENIIPLCDLISSLELTLSNSTNLNVLQMSKIEALEQVVREYRHDHREHYSDGAWSGCAAPHETYKIVYPHKRTERYTDEDSRCDMCKDADALLSAPTEPTPEESE